MHIQVFLSFYNVEMNRPKMAKMRTFVDVLVNRVICMLTYFSTQYVIYDLISF